MDLQPGLSRDPGDAADAQLTRRAGAEQCRSARERDRGHASEHPSARGTSRRDVGLERSDSAGLAECCACLAGATASGIEEADPPLPRA